MKDYEVRFQETDKQIKEFSRLKTTAINLATENGFLKSQMQQLLGKQARSSDNEIQRRIDHGPNTFGNGGGIC